MAEIRDVQPIGDASTESITPPVFDYAEGDLLVMVVVCDGAGVTFTPPSGYTNTTTTESNGANSSGIFTKVATATETPQTVSWTGLREAGCWLVSVEDPDLTTPVNQVAIAQSSEQSPQAPALTTTSDGCLVIHFAGVDTSSNPRQISRDTGLMGFDTLYSGPAIELTAGWTYQETAGAIYRPTIEIGVGARNSHRIAIAIAGNLTTRPAYFPTAIPPTTVLHPLHGTSSFSPYGGAARDVSVATELNGTINGTVFSYNAPGLVSGGGLNGVNGSMFTESPSNGSTENLWGGGYDLTSVDLSTPGNSVVIHMRTSTAEKVGFKSIEEDGAVFGMRSGAGNFRLWTISGYDSKANPANYSAIVFDPSSALFETEERGTFDPSTVVSIVVAGHKVSASGLRPRLQWAELHKLNTITVVGGDATKPASLETFVDALKSNGLQTVINQGGGSSSQIFSFQELQVGDGVNTVHFASPNSALEFSKSGDSAKKQMQLQLPAGSLGITFYGVAGDTIDLSNIVMSCENDWYYKDHVLATSAATRITDAHTVIGATVVLQDVYTAQKGVSFLGSKSITLNGADLSGGCIFEGTVAATAISTLSAASQVGLQALVDKLANCEFNKNNIAVPLNYTGPVADITLNFPSVTNSGNTIDIDYQSTNASALTAVMVGTSNADQAKVSFGGAATGVTVQALASGITFNDLIAGSQVKVFATGTTTKKFNVASSGTSEQWEGAGDEGTVDYTIRKAGYVDVHVVGLPVGTNALSFNITQKLDRAYEASTGLTYTTDTTADTATKRFTLTKKTTVQNWYSFYVEQWISNALFENVKFPLVTNGPNSFSALDGWEFTLEAAIASFSRDGFRYLSISGVLTACWAAVQSLAAGDVSAFTAEYQQTAGGAVVKAAAAGKVDQLIKVFGDATHGNIDVKNYLVFKYQPNGYRETRVDLVSLNDGKPLEDQLYVMSMDPVAIAAPTGDPAIALTVTNHGAAPVTWNGKPYSVTIVDTAGTASGEDILRELNYNLSLDAAYQGDDPFNWPEMVVEAGAAYETKRGTVEGSAGAALKGVRVLRGASPHPHFARFQADDGTYYAPPVTATISGGGMLTDGANILLQIANESAKGAPAWSAGTAHAKGDKVLRTAGVGTELTAGLYMVCTGAGVSHASTEPVWDTVVGNTTSDNTVTWTTYAILFFDADPAGASYAGEYTEGEEFSQGDTFSYAWAELNGATSFKKDKGTGIAASTGFAFNVAPIAEGVYAGNGKDGSLQTHFAANFAADYIALVTDTDYELSEAFAYYCFTLTLSAGMYGFWGGVDAVDSGNYLVNVPVLNLFLDETVGAFIKQKANDTARLYRTDGLRPVLDPTTGGYGVEVNWKNPVHTISTGSVLTEGEKSSLANSEADSAAAKASTAEIRTRLGLEQGNAWTDTPTQSGDTSGNIVIDNTGDDETTSTATRQ